MKEKSVNREADTDCIKQKLATQRQRNHYPYKVPSSILEKGYWRLLRGSYYYCENLQMEPEIPLVAAIVRGILI